MFFFLYPALTEIYTYCHPLALHDALPIYVAGGSEAVDDQDHVVAIGLPEPHQAEAQHVVDDETVLGDARVWNALGGVERDLAGHGLLLSACMLLHSAIIAAAMCSASAAMVRDGLSPMAQGSTAPSAT